MEKKANLPFYEHPPVQEVVIALQFSTASSLKMVHLTEFWGAHRGEFPEVDDQPPFAGLEERSTLELQLFQLPPLRRLRMSQLSGEFSIQLQDNRFIVNWIKNSETATYPRFPTIFAHFKKYLDSWLDYLAKSEVGEVGLSHFELTYVNEIGPAAQVLPKLPQLLRVLSWAKDDADQPMTPKSVNLAIQLDMPGGPGNLITTINTAKKSDGTDVVLFILKSVCSTKNTALLEDWFNVAHEAIVGTFTNMTTTEAHASWGRADVPGSRFSIQ